MSRSARLRSQDGFIREVVWIVVILAIIAVVILDGMAIFNAYQSAGNGSADAAKAGLTEYAQTTNVQAAKLAAATARHQEGARDRQVLGGPDLRGRPHGLRHGQDDAPTPTPSTTWG